MDETDDVLNSDTFGDGGAPVGMLWIVEGAGHDVDDTTGQDFDFAGSTARVADVLQEEHAVFDRTRKPVTKHIQQSAAPVVKTSVAESRHIPTLAPDMSLWGAPTAPSQPQLMHQQFSQALNEPTQQHTSGPRKFMSLEEVEAQILMNQQARQQQPQVSAPQMQHPVTMGMPPPMGQPMAHFHQQIPQHTPSPGAHGLHPFAPPPHDAFPPMQLPPHIQQQMHMLQQNQNMLPQHLQQAHLERLLQQQQQLAHQQQMRMPPREPLQQQQPQNPQVPPPMHNRTQSGIGGAPISAQQLQNMPEVERIKYLEEESKRLKRNHKIAQLARYNGLMTPQDKNFIQRIQLQQLVSIGSSEDNANEDFYYIVHSAIRARVNPQQPLSQLAQTYLFRNGGRNNRRQDNHMQRMEQQVARAVAAAKARPKANSLVLEGSLGKISFSNVKTPRPMLNIKRLDSDQSKVNKPTASADRKSLLRIVENVYDALLEVEVYERDSSKLQVQFPSGPPPEVVQEWEEKREQLTENLFKAMKVLEPIDPTSRTRHPFIAILSFAKMKRAIPRIFRHLNPEQRVTILTMIVVHLDVLDVVRKGVYRPDEPQLPSATREEIDLFVNNVLPPLLGYMYDAQLTIAVGLLGLLLDRVDVHLISRTKIGLAFLTMFFSRAEIVKQSGKADEQELQHWQNVYDRFFETLQGHWMDCFPPSGRFVDDQYVWQFLASMAVGANEHQQRALVGAVK